MKVYLWKNEQEHGPFSEDELRAQIEADSLSPRTFARRENASDWKRLGEVLGLTTATAAKVSGYIVQYEGKRKGPYSAEEVWARLKIGRMVTSDLSWREGEPQWTPLSSRKEFSQGDPGAGAESAARASVPAPAMPSVVPVPRRKRVGAGALVLLALLIGAGLGAYLYWGHLAHFNTMGAALATPSGRASTAPSPTALAPPPAFAAPASSSLLPSLSKIAPAISGDAPDEGELDPTPPADPSPLAIEIMRYLHKNKVEGATENQMAVAASAIAGLIQRWAPEKAALDECYDGKDPATRAFNFLHLSSGPGFSDKERWEFDHRIRACMPPRMTVNANPAYPDFEFPLPPRKWRGPQPDGHPRGVLASEVLTTFAAAYGGMWSSDHPNPDPMVGYKDNMNQLVPPLSAEMKVIRAVYAEGPGQPQPYYFWYKDAPDNVAQQLKSQDAKDPIFEIGAAVDEAPIDEPEILPLLAQQAGDAHRLQTPLPPPTDFAAHPDLLNSGVPIPRRLILDNEPGVLANQDAMSVEVEVHGLWLKDVDVRDDIVNSLTAAGIKILPDTDGTYPKLILKVDANQGSVTQQYGFQQFYSLSGDLSYHCLFPSNLKGRTEKFIDGRVWFNGIFGLSISSNDVRDTIQSKLTNKFVEDYKAANGK